MSEKIVMLPICEINDYEEQPFKVREDEEMEALVESNLQRECILPSERAFAYKLKNDAQKRQGERTDLTSGHSVHKWEDFDRCDRQVRRYIRLTELISPLLDKVDEKNLPIGAGTVLSFLNVKAQSQVNDYLERELCAISKGQAAKIRKKGEAGELSDIILSEILREKEDNENFSIDTKKLRSYFPKEFIPAQCRKILWHILDEWVKGKKKENAYCN